MFSYLNFVLSTKKTKASAQLFLRNFFDVNAWTKCNTNKVYSGTILKRFIIDTLQEFLTNNNFYVNLLIYI